MTYIEGGDKKVEGFISSDEESEEEEKKNDGWWNRLSGSI